MRHTLNRLAFASIVLISLLAAGTSPALATPGNGNGAITGGGPFTVNDCTYDSQADTTFCYTAHGESHFVYTTTGGYNSDQNYHYCFAIYTGTDTSVAPFDQQCGYNHEQFHTDKAGDVQVLREASGDTAANAAGDTFCFSATYHEANGQVQYDYFSFTC